MVSDLDIIFRKAFLGSSQSSNRLTKFLAKKYETLKISDSSRTAEKSPGNSTKIRLNIIPISFWWKTASNAMVIFKANHVSCTHERLSSFID